MSICNKKSPKVLLIQSPPWSNLMPPLGIAYLAQYLRQNSIKVEIFDLNIEIYNNSEATKTNVEIRDIWFNEDMDFWTSGKANLYFRTDIEVAAKKIVEMDIDIIGISVVGIGVLFANEFIEKIKDLNPNLKIIIGGGGASVRELRCFFIKNKIDYFVVGEGEIPLLGIIKKIYLNDNASILKNCDIYKDDKEDFHICVQKKGDFDLDLVTYPTFEEFNLSLYEDKISLPIIASKGCVNRCVFCQDCQMIGKYKCRNPDNIVDEIKYHINCYKIKHRVFVDLLINGDINKLEAMCKRIIKKKIDVQWSCLAAVRKNIGIEMFKNMKEAGCEHIVFGCESFSPEILKRMRKGFSPIEAEENLRAAHECRIQRIDINLIVGFLGESEENITQTLKFLEDNRKYITAIGNIGLLKILHGSYMYYHCDEYNIESNSINDPIRWHTRDYSNTYEKRRLNGKRYIDKIVELGIPIDKDPDGLKESYKDDDRIRLYFKKASLLINDRHYENAMKKLREGLDKFPDSVDLLKTLERIYNETDRWSAVEDVCNKILRLDPESKDTKFELGKAYLRQNRLEQAYRIFIELESQSYINYQLYNEMGLVSLKLNNFIRAQLEFERGFSLYPDNPYLVLNLGFALLYQNKYIEAEKCFRKVLLLDEHMSDAHAGLGFLYLYLKKYNEAEAEFMKAYYCDKKSIRALTGLGHFFYENENYDQAEEKFKEAIAINGHIPEIYSSLEQVLIKRGKFKEADYCKQKVQNLIYRLEEK